MKFGLLGPMAVVDGQGQELALHGPKLCALLAILLLNGNQDVASDRLIELLWGEQAPRSAAKSLQVHVSRLRRALHRDCDEPAERLLTTPQGYRLRVAPGEVDLERFEQLIAEADGLVAEQRWEAAADRLRQSLELWRGDPLSDFAYESFAQSEIARLGELHLGALEQRVAVELSLGHEAAVIGELELLIREHPYHERLHGQLMLALYRVGRQADALAAFRAARARLADELGIEPSAELAQLHTAILAQDATLDRVPGELSEPAHPTNLPAQTPPLIGRRDEQAQILARLRSGRGSVITLTGIGGIGKTKLATAVASGMLEDFAGGVFLVRLAGISEPRSILPMIAEAIGLTGGTDEPLQTLLPNRLSKLPTLLILDNLEQLVDAASIIGDLAARASQLRLLATSQVPLRISSEVVIQVGPLHADDASALFLERLCARDWEFSAEADEQAMIASICQRVDGMPLAIELAAARAHTLGLRELERRLETPLGLLTRGDRDRPERQRSLRAAIEWSQSLLSREDNDLFVALGACAGPVPLGMVAAIAASPADETAILDRLDALLEFSFIRRREDPQLETRFMMPQALRNYAAEQLAESGGDAVIRGRHARYVAEVAYAARLWKEGATEEQLAALRAIEAEIRAAVAWAQEHDPSLHVRICAGAAVFWIYRSVIPEVIAELERAIDSGAGTPAERARCLTIQAQCLRFGGQQARAMEHAEQAHQAWQQVDDEVERALGYGDLGWTYRWLGRLHQAIELDEEALAVLRRTGERRLILRGLTMLANDLDREDLERTEQLVAEADELTAEPYWWLDSIRGDCAMQRGDMTAAIAAYTTSLAWAHENGEEHQALMDLRCLGVCLGRAGHAEAALEAIELIRLHEEHTGRVGSHSELAAWLQESRTAALDLAGSVAEAEATARARAVPISLRVQRVLDLCERALSTAARK